MSVSVPSAYTSIPIWYHARVMQPSQPQTIRVLCMDDNDFVGEALSRRARRQPGIEWSGWTRSADELDDAVRTNAPDVILMDIDMPGYDTFALVERLAIDHPRVRVVMFSGHARPDYAERALNAGAWGFISKDDDPDRIFDAVRMVSRGEMYLSAGILRFGPAMESE